MPQCCEKYIDCQRIQNTNNDLITRVAAAMSKNTSRDAGGAVDLPAGIMAETRTFLEDLLRVRSGTSSINCKLRFNDTFNYWSVIINNQTGLLLWVDYDKNQLYTIRGFGKK